MERNKDAHSILVTRFSALGDVAMTIPVVYSACVSNPDLHFVFITKKAPAGIFINPPKNLTIYPIDTAQYKGIFGLRRLAVELKRKFNPKYYADLHDVLRTKVLRLWLRTMGVKVRRIRKGKRGKNALTRRYNKVMIPLVSTRARYREVFYNLSLTYNYGFKGLYQDVPADPALFAAATAPKQEGEHWIGIAPFAKHRGKIYPEELMEQVVKALSRRKGYRIFIFGAGSMEANTIGRWAMKFDNVVNMATLRLGFAAELSLMSFFDAMISMDSANMHLAALVGTRVVSIWGATHPFCGFMGWRQRKEDAVQLDMVCRPCSVFGNRPCRRGDFHCMYGISPERIIQTLDAGANKGN
jgi:ADP-heptose:LPS heptosyltransferase